MDAIERRVRRTVSRGGWPRVQAWDGDCACLIAADGMMRTKAWPPRLLQPIFGVCGG